MLGCKASIDPQTKIVNILGAHLFDRRPFDV